MSNSLDSAVTPPNVTFRNSVIAVVYADADEPASPGIPQFPAEAQSFYSDPDSASAPPSPQFRRETLKSFLFAPRENYWMRAITGIVRVIRGIVTDGGSVESEQASVTTEKAEIRGIAPMAVATVITNEGPASAVISEGDSIVAVIQPNTEQKLTMMGRLELYAQSASSASLTIKTHNRAEAGRVMTTVQFDSNDWCANHGQGEEARCRKGPALDVVGVVLVVHPGYVKFLKAAIASIDAQDRKFNHKTVVYDLGDQIDAPEIEVPRDWDLVVGSWKNPNPARNAGLRQCAHVTWCCFWDADNVMDRDYLRNSLHHLRSSRPNEAIWYPMVLQTKPDGGVAQRLVDRGEWSYLKSREYSLADTAAFWRVQPMLSVGGWGEHQCRHDDYEVSLRLSRSGFVGRKMPFSFNHVLHGENRSKWGTKQDGDETALSLWTAWTFGIVTLWSGSNKKAHAKVFEWLMNADLPPNTHLHWVDNSGGKMTSLLYTWAAKIRRRVKGVSISSIGSPHIPKPGESYFAFPRHQNVAGLYNEVLAGVREDMIVTLEDDTVPPLKGLRRLARFILPGRNTGFAAGVYRSRHNPSRACLSIDKKLWLSVDIERMPKQPFEIGMSGVGFAIIPAWALRKCLPQLCGGEAEQVMGWDGNLCLALRSHGYTLFAVPDVRCRHLCPEVLNFDGLKPDEGFTGNGIYGCYGV